MRKLYLLLAWLSLSASAISQNLVAYYPFNGNANDESGNGINSTYTGAGVTLTTDRFGNVNSAYNFNGATNSYMRMPADLMPATNRTISLWFNVPDVTNRPGLLGYGGNGGCGTTLLMGLNLLGSGQYYVQGHCGNNTAGYTYPAAPVNNWYHWVLTINGSAQKIYINGQLKSTNNTFSGSTAVAGKDFSLGVITSISGTAPYTDANVGYLTGKLDDVRIYDNAMTDAQVLQLYQNESTGLVAFYPFNGNANDESGNGNHGTVNGATLTTDRYGNTNKAYNFTNPNYISVLNSNMFGDEFTVSYWFKINSYFGQRGVMSNVAVPNGGFQQAFDGTSFSYVLGYSFIGGYNPNYFYANYTMVEPLSQWHHLALTYKKLGTNSSETKLYINGNLKKSDVHVVPITYTPNAVFYIGQNHGGLNFQGDLDDIKIYNRNLSPNEIQQLADIPMMPDLLAYYPLNGNTNDVSGYGHNGIVYGAIPTADKYDNNSSAYSFNGDVGIALSNSSSLHFSGTPFALSAWVKYSSITSASVIVGKHFCGTPNGYILGVENNIPVFWLSNSGSWNIVSAGTAYNDNKWHHVVGVFTGSQQLIYMDGELKSSQSAAFDNPNVGSLVLIGNTSGSCGSGWFTGSIDEVKIYGAALDALQVETLHKQSRGSGNAVNFDGVDDHIVTNEYLVPTTGDFTVELWVYNRNISGYREFISQGGGGSAFYIGTSDVTGNIRLGDTWGTNVALPVNKWVHVAVVKSGPNGILFMDGIQVATSIAYSVGAGGTQTQIGKQYGGFLEHPDALLDEIRIWNIALSAAEVRNWMNRKITPNHPAFTNLVSYYNFDEKNVLHAYEMKGAKTATLVSGPQYITSGAPIGDTSVANYSNPNTHGTTLTLSSGELFEVYDPVWGLTGVNIYVVKDPPETQVGILGLGTNDHYFGVHINSGGNPISYTARYNYTGNPFVSHATEPTLQLFKRADNSVTTWANSGATLNTTTNTLTVTGQNTEYILGSSGFSLPVTLLSFEAKKINATTAQLNWKTAQELNNKGFELQRSFDGSIFINIAFIAGAGNTDVVKEYCTTDMPGRTGRVYYRLKQIDVDGNDKFSLIASLLFDTRGLIKVYPNPAQHQVIIEGVDNYNRIQLFDVTGKMVKEQLNHGQYLLTMNLVGLKSGMYLLRLINGIENQTIKLMIGN